MSPEPSVDSVKTSLREALGPKAKITISKGAARAGGSSGLDTGAKELDKLVKTASDKMPELGNPKDILERGYESIYNDVISPTVKKEVDRVLPALLEDQELAREKLAELPSEHQEWLTDAYPEHAAEIEERIEEYNERTFDPDNYTLTRITDEKGEQTYAISFEDGQPSIGHMRNFIDESFGTLPFIQDGLELTKSKDSPNTYNLTTSVRTVQMILDRNATNRQQYGETFDLPQIS